MKIETAMMALSSENQSDQLSASRQEESVTQRTGRRRRRQRPWQQGMIIDRVDVGRWQRTAYQSNEYAGLSSRSQVIDADSGTKTEYTGEYALSRLVGGVIDKEVVIRNMEAGRDVPLNPVDPDTDDSRPLDAEQAGIAGRGREWEMAIRSSDIHFESQQVAFSSRGQVTTEDGRTIDFSLDFNLDRSFLSRTEETTLIRRWQGQAVLTDPLVVSLNGQVPELSETRFDFDLDGDGEMENIHFAGAGSGFLAFDKNMDHQVNDGSELFGPGTGNGFEELAAHDLDQNNWIDENDLIFSQLSVWTRDKDGNDQLISLKDAGIGAISLDYAATLFDYKQADTVLDARMQRSGVFLFENGNVGSVHQIDLASQAVESVPQTAQAPGELSTIPAAVIPRAEPESSVQQADAADETHMLNDLLDRLEQLKEEMGRLYEAMNERRGTRRSRRRQRGAYRGIQIDSSVLLPGRRRSLMSRMNRLAL